MPTMAVEFGWSPSSLDFAVGDITVAPLTDLDTKVAGVRAHPCVDGDWIYAPSPHISQIAGASGL